jgi:hypothetical protein
MPSELDPIVRPAWLSEEDELPHPPPDTALWCENYLAYAYAPASQIGVYVHMCHRGGPPELWDEKFVVALPDDRFLLAKSFSRGFSDQGPATAGVTMRCREPFRIWTLSFHGAARLISGEELRSSPLTDGLHTPVELELTCRAFGPAYDFGAEKLDQSWGTGHYEQAHRVGGELTVGGRTFSLEGTGLRDHSWGTRDYAQIGSTIWVHGQFPRSGRSFMAVQVSGRPPRKPFAYAVSSDGRSVLPAAAQGLRPPADRAQAGEKYTFDLVTAEGTSRVRAEILKSIDMAFIGPSEIGLGTHHGADVNHAYLESFTRFEWDGEVGYGATDVSIDRVPQDSD